MHIQHAHTNTNNYGERYGVGDVISCAIDLETGAASFAKNGQPLGVAFTINPAAIERGLFPHILLKNVEVHVSFAVRLSSSFPDYEPMQSAVALGACTARVPPPPRPSLVMLVGLPATGKSTWAELHMKQHPEKRYTLLSTDNILEQMKVAGLTQLQRALGAAHARGVECAQQTHLQRGVAQAQLPLGPGRLYIILPL